MTDRHYQPEIFPDQLLLHRVNSDLSMRRFYYMTVQRDLFGGATLVREWGRIGSSGQVRFEPYLDEGQAVTALSQITKKKQKKGYREHRP